MLLRCVIKLETLYWRTWEILDSGIFYLAKCCISQLLWLSSYSFLPTQLLGLSGETWFMQTVRMHLNQIFKVFSLNVISGISKSGYWVGRLEHYSSPMLLSSRGIITKVGLSAYSGWPKMKFSSRALFTLANDQVNRAHGVRVSSFIYQRCLGINYAQDRILFIVFAFYPGYIQWTHEYLWI